MKILSIIFLLFAFVAAEAQTIEPADANLNKELAEFNKINREIREILTKSKGNKLAELRALQTLEKTYENQNPMVKSVIWNNLMNLSAELGDYRGALAFADKANAAFYSQTLAKKEFPLNFKPSNALKNLVEKIADRSVVMINEAHHIPQHRVFSIELLRALKQKGFTHFAAEAVFEDSETLKKRGFHLSAGYLAEPVYAELIREALRLGLTVVPYEIAFDQEVRGPQDREDIQAKNLYERVSKLNPNAKLFVHCGYAHNSKSKWAGKISSMAMRFKELSGLEPFTIDQTEMTEKADPKFEPSLYRELTDKKILTDETLVFVDENGKIWASNPKSYDATVFHPRSRYDNERPNWLAESGFRKPRKLPKNVCAREKSCLVRAFRVTKDENESPPTDQFIVEKDLPKPVLMLPVGEFIVKSISENGAVLKTWRIRQEPCK